VWCLGERECSIQRRHQKIVEEAPSPLVERVQGMRERLFDAAQAAAKAIGYTGAGTVEFLADDDGRFFFLEMNTRLQVEHPVTECTTGTDLVALQVFVADGGRLDPVPPVRRGHSIEVRLYAEDPAADWQPQSGTVQLLDVPGVHARFSIGTRESGVRLDSGVAAGSAVTIHYDPMLAKVISWAPDRADAAATLAAALRRARIHGLRTNRDLLVRLLSHPAFLAGATDTAFFDTHGLAELAAPIGGAATDRLCALVVALTDDAQARRSAPALRGIPSGWRNVFSQNQLAVLTVDGNERRVSYRLGRDGLHADGYDDVTLIAYDPTSAVLDVEGVRHRFTVARYGNDRYLDSALGSRHVIVAERFTDPATAVAAGSLLAPMPGSVVRVAVRVGDTVTAGQPMLWLEAMKMQHQIDAPADGVVSELPVEIGRQVDVGAVLAIVSPMQDAQEDAQ
jgi:propionyl-CoA carboxylase alpha chain